MTKEIDRHKAPKLEREIANYWADLYRRAQKSPDRKVRIESGLVVQADDTEFLITLLENFAKAGTFRMVPKGMSDMMTLLKVYSQYQLLLLEGLTEKKAWREAEKRAGPPSSYRRIKARIFGRHPNLIRKRMEKKELRNELRSNSLTVLDSAWGISHPKSE